MKKLNNTTDKNLLAFIKLMEEGKVAVVCSAPASKTGKSEAIKALVRSGLKKCKSP
jgi:hypothetical protein